MDLLMRQTAQCDIVSESMSGSEAGGGGHVNVYTDSWEEGERF